MYKTRLGMHIVGGSYSAGPEDVWLVRWIKLPFPPYPGLTINLNDSGELGIVKEVNWYVDKEEFWIYMESDQTVYNEMRPKRFGARATDDPKIVKIMQDMIDSYRTVGWLVDSVITDEWGIEEDTNTEEVWIPASE